MLKARPGQDNSVHMSPVHHATGNDHTAEMAGRNRSGETEAQERTCLWAIAGGFANLGEGRASRLVFPD